MKQYYAENELVLHKPTNKVARVISVNPEKLSMKVENILNCHTYTDNLWNFGKATTTNDTILIQSKVRETAHLLEKNSREDAGYDVWLDIPEDFKYVYKGKEVYAWTDGFLDLKLEPHRVHTLPTGIRVATTPDYWTDFKHERGSTGQHGLAVLSGVVDSGYRGEVFLNLIPMQNKDFIITNTVTRIVETQNQILFPYNKAVAQMVLQRNYHADIIEVPTDVFMSLNSERGTNALGSTDK